MADVEMEVGARETRGMWFEEFRVGQVFEAPIGRTVSEADIVQFAGLTADFNPLHVDEEYARKTAFRRRIAHGMLVQSMACGLGALTGIFNGTIAALVGMEISFVAPVAIGDTVRLTLEVVEVDPEPSRRSGNVRLKGILRNQKQQVVTESDWRTLMLRERWAKRRERPVEEAGGKG